MCRQKWKSIEAHTRTNSGAFSRTCRRACTHEHAHACSPIHAHYKHAHTCKHTQTCTQYDNQCIPAGSGQRNSAPCRAPFCMRGRSTARLLRACIALRSVAPACAPAAYCTAGGRARCAGGTSAARCCAQKRGSRGKVQGLRVRYSLQRKVQGLETQAHPKLVQGAGAGNVSTSSAGARCRGWGLKHSQCCCKVQGVSPKPFSPLQPSRLYQEVRLHAGFLVTSPQTLSPLLPPRLGIWTP